MAAGDLTDLATARIAAAITEPASSDTDQILGALITAISAYVPSVLDRNVLADNYSEIYEGNGGQVLMLRQRPIIQISSVAWDGFILSTIGSLSSSGIWSDGRNARLNGFTFPRGAPVEIVYSAGYVDVPEDLSLAVAELVAEAYSRRQHVGELSRAQGGQVTTTFDAREMHAAIASKLMSYRIGAPC